MTSKWKYRISVRAVILNFSGFETYNMLVNPNNRLVKKVLMRMVESGDTFSWPLVPTRASLCSDPKLGKEILKNLAGLSTNLRQIQGSTTTDAQYQRALAQFRSNYYPRQRDGRIDAIEAGMTESRWVAQQLNRPVVKAFNNIYARHLMELGQPKGTPGRIALPVARRLLARKGKSETLSVENL